MTFVQNITPSVLNQIGFIVNAPVAIAPMGYIPCNGSFLLITDFISLHNAIGDVGASPYQTMYFNGSTAPDLFIGQVNDNIVALRDSNGIVYLKFQVNSTMGAYTFIAGTIYYSKPAISGSYYTYPMFLTYSDAVANTNKINLGPPVGTATANTREARYFRLPTGTNQWIKYQ